MTFTPSSFTSWPAIILASTALAVTRRNVMHAIVYLVLSFFGTALLFYLLGAPVAGGPGGHHLRRGHHGAVSVHRHDAGDRAVPETPRGAYLRQWLPAAGPGGRVPGASPSVLLLVGSGAGAPLPLAMASPLAFGRFLFRTLLVRGGNRLVSAVCGPGGGLYLGRREGQDGRACSAWSATDCVLTATC